MVVKDIRKVVSATVVMLLIMKTLLLVVAEAGLVAEVPV